MIAASALVMSGCDRNNPDNGYDSGSEIWVKLSGDLEVEPAGGVYEFSYEIIKPVDGGFVNAAVDPLSKWVTDLVVSESDGLISFSCGENIGTGARTAVITVTYKCGNEILNQKAVRVVQASPFQNDDEERDLEIDAVYADAVYLSDKDGVMDVRLVFTDMEVNGDQVTPPGSMLYVEALMQLDEDGALYVGPYVMPDEQTLNTPGVLYSGQTVDVGGAMINIGTYLDVLSETGQRTSYLVVDGTMLVEGGPGAYDIVCDMETEDGTTLRCRWSGDLVVRNVPGPFSTLTDDYTLDFSAVSASAVYFGDYYQNGTDNWYISILPSGNSQSDGMYIDLACSAGGGFSGGIPSGTYTAAEGGVPEAGQYVRGSSDTYSVYGTVYVGKFEDGYPTAFAPAMSGDLVITNNGDGTYVFEFGFKDDRGYVWDGSWSGTVELRPRE